MSVRSGLSIGPTGAAVFITVFLAVTRTAGAAEFDNLFAGANDFGNVGLMQTPTARMRPDGDFGLGVSTVRPYNQIQFFAQPLPWLEASVRYTDVTNRFYSNDPSFSGTQHYKDKSADVKVRLLNEAQYWPSIALGMQDIGGTGFFSSEYLVSSYHWYDFDLSFGLGWGRLGSGGDIPNPFGAFGHHFDQDRFSAVQNSIGVAGNVGAKYWFTGQTIGPFGGVAWNTPIKGLSLRVEYDGNNYQHEGLGDNQRQDSPINVGLAYRGISGLDMGVGFERGNTVMARFAIYTNFQNLRGVFKSADPTPLALYPNQSGDASTPNNTALPASESNAAAVAPEQAAIQTSAPAGPPAAPEISSEQRHEFVLKLKDALKQQGFTLIAVDYDGFLKEVRVWLNQDKYRNSAKAVGRTARVLAATAPDEISKFTLVFVDQGVENYRAAVYRQDFEKAAHDNDPDAALSSIVLKGPGEGYSGAQYIDDTRTPKFSWDMGPAVRQSVGGPDTFYAGQLYWKVAAAVQVTDHLNLTGAAGFNIINNFDQIKLQSNSTLPHVRSDIVKYLRQGDNGLINLEADYIWSPYPDWYHRLSAGIFEEMYGGVATELLYRPYGRSWAVAFDVNRVKQRGYDEMFDFLGYTVTTGHVALYYKPGYKNLLIKLSAGQYLAKDRGATLDVSREFDSGVRLGIFATKTDISAAQFGEGSFDKGVYITLPLDLFFAKSTRREAGFTFRPLTRDGGQMVYDGPELYFSVKDGQPSDFARGASELLK
ncbi:YjbH domain-containing protein [Nevskia soli]|uniref:YjbH domain-containing protein n=1 Tax=Nevskia soli TaxID=418856 RepID=UPI0004A753C9|nr:YjbH domain-containing protein [Nevskia soli]